MTARRLVRLATATALAAPLLGFGVGTAAASALTPATSFACSASGTGSTLGAAVNAAEQELRGDYTVLGGFTVSYDTQYPDGSWYAVVSSRCGNPR